MKELTVSEMEEIAGGAPLARNGILGNVAAAALGAVAGAAFGTLIGGTQSGAIGGLLGFGLISNAVSTIWGFIAGGMIAGAAGLSVG
ncbi:Blp family class II bacteriocin [Entomohabitans teleogrylli]|uniref:Blp family class II bacteriocin n=1 Tax=Entomohabitans teleogrylli TaxID=1384589 RepID=UPI000EB602ED|nr:Blp family class II bacteriocin [Entomohabitans teleogrylli]